MLDGSRVRGAVAVLAEEVAALEPGRLSGDDARALLGVFARAEKLAAAARTMLAKRVEDTFVPTRAGHRSAAEAIAKELGTTPGQANATLNLANRLDKLPDTQAALRAGELSEAQAREVASAATADRTAEGDLLDAARRGDLRRLREQGARVRAAASDEDERHRRHHRSRSLRFWTDGEGAGRADLRITNDVLARVKSAVEARAGEIFDDRRRSGDHEGRQAYLADALVDLVCGDAEPSGRPGAQVVVRVDLDALRRRQTEPGETCEMAGVGPIPVKAAEALMGEAMMWAVITDGVDVYNVTNLGRKVTAAQRVALFERDGGCVHCGATVGLEIDHVTGWALTGKTELDDLALLCRFAHYLKTHQGWRVVGPPAARRFVPPDDHMPAPADEPRAGPDPPDLDALF